MAYSDIYNAANDAIFQGRCMVAMWIAAQAIVSEAANTPNHPARLDWANSVLKDKVIITPRQLAMQVLRNAVIASNPGASSDSDVQFQVNSTIDQIMAIG